MEGTHITNRVIDWLIDWFQVLSGSHSYESQVVPQSPLCKLGTQGYQWCNRSKSKDLRSGSAPSEGRRRWTSQLRKREQKLALPFPFLFYAQQKRRCPLTSMRANFYSSLPNQTLISSRNTHPDTPRNNVLLAIWVSISPGQMTHQMNQHTFQPNVCWLPASLSVPGSAGVLGA